AMVRAAVDAYKTGDKTEARTLLERAIEIDSYNETAWLWLSAVVDSKEEQQTCLENVLVINPESDRARQGLKSLGIDPDAVLQAAYQEPEPEEDPYAVPSSSSSVAHATGQAEPEQYDQWVDGLGIGGEAGGTTDYGSAGDDLFGDDDLFADDDAGFDIDESVFEEPIYSANDTFNDDTLFEGDYASTGADTFVDDYDDDDFFDDGAGDFGTATSTYDSGGGLSFGMEGDEDVYDDEDDFEDLAPAEPDIDALFAQIPAGIEMQRVPGEKAPAPTIHYVIIGFLVLVNLGAVGFATLQFIG
ncbi:MAG: hypothetical protein AAFQ07_20790, partial [Chloroflexota bacterium]